VPDLADYQDESYARRYADVMPTLVRLFAGWLYLTARDATAPADARNSQPQAAIPRRRSDERTRRL
jgi:hypothetical protein